jgi:hypothetical protein
MTNSMYDKPTADIIFSSERAISFLIKSGIR